MRLSAAIASQMRLLMQLLADALRVAFASFFSKVGYGRTGAGAGTALSVTPVERKVDEGRAQNEMTTPTSVNYHFTRQCNYKCGFCFHTAKTSFVLPLDEAKRGLKLLKESGNSDTYGYCVLLWQTSVMSMQ